MVIGEPLAVFNWIPEPGAEEEQGRWGKAGTEALVSTRILRNNKGQDKDLA